MARAARQRGRRAPTLGGVLACNLAGPRRLRAGAARDHFLGFAAVNGRGEAFKAGGKVVKNVTGYDLCKLHRRLLRHAGGADRSDPQGDAAAGGRSTVLLHGLADDGGRRRMAAALEHAARGLGRAHLPAAGRAPLRRALSPTAGAVTALRLEGPAPSVAFRAEPLERCSARARGSTRPRPRSSGARSASAAACCRRARACVWRLCPTPSPAPAVVAAIRACRAAEAFLRLGRRPGLARLDAAEAGADGGAAHCARGDEPHAAAMRRWSARRRRCAQRRGLRAGGGGARGPDRRVKESFDPRRAQSRPPVGRVGEAMQTNFTLAQLADPDIAKSEKILRACVHCGFCTATCPTYVLLGDELDCPRGRIYLIKDMLENDRPATARWSSISTAASPASPA